MQKHLVLFLVAAAGLRAGVAHAGLKPSPYRFRLPDATGPTPIEQGPKYRGAGGDRVPGDYIVVLNDDVLPSQVPEVARDLGLSVGIFRRIRKQTLILAAGSGPTSWPTATGAKVADGTVTWQVVPSDEYNNTQTTSMLVEGLDWILREDTSLNRNTGPKKNAVVTLSQYRRADEITGTTAKGV
jgi:hypothetical protein